MPVRRPNPHLIALSGLVCAFVLTAAVGVAQVPGNLPSAPEPQRAAVSDGREQAPRLFMAPMAGSVYLE